VASFAGDQLLTGKMFSVTLTLSRLLRPLRVREVVEPYPNLEAKSSSSLQQTFNSNIIVSATTTIDLATVVAVALPNFVVLNKSTIKHLRQ
jgi:hypothetical protein